METRFVVPVIVSTAFHSLVLLLGNGPHVPAPPPVTTPVAPPSDVVITTIPEDETPPPDAAEESGPTKGSPAISLPTLDEPWGKVPIDAITFTPAPVRPETTIGDRIPGLPIGVLDGDPNSTGGPKIVGANFLDAPPRTRLRVAPDYPREAKVSGVTGEVMVEFIVDETGHVLRPRVVRSTDSRFESATLRAVERWRFEPGKKDGHTVRFRMAVPVMFTLDD